MWLLRPIETFRDSLVFTCLLFFSHVSYYFQDLSGSFRCVTAWSFCELHQCVTTGAGDGVVHQQRLQLPMGKRCAFGRKMKLMRSACHKKGSAVTPAKTRNTRNSKKEATGSEMQIFGLARVKSSQSKSSDELCANRFNIVQWQVWVQDLWTGARGHRSCNTLAPQAWPSGRECHPNCNGLSTEGKQLSHSSQAFETFRKKLPKVPINWNNRNRQGCCAYRFWSVKNYAPQEILESWGSSHLVIQIVAAKHVQSTQW